MALEFPKSPIVGQVYDYSPFRYQWDGVCWLTVGKGAETVSESIKAHEQAPAIHSMAGIDWQGSLSHRNLLINGGFNIQQRSTHGTIQNIGSNSEIWGADRWRVHSLSGTGACVTHYNDGSQFLARNYLQLNTSTSGSYVVRQVVESLNCAFAVGSKLTLSCSIACNGSAKTVALRVYGSKNVDAPEYVEVAKQGFSNASTGQISMTFTATAECRNGMIVDLMVDGQTAGFFAVLEMQLERGEVATPFEHRPYGYELSLCQRYYQYMHIRGSVNMPNGTWVVACYVYPVVMRTRPVVSYGPVTRSTGLVIDERPIALDDWSERHINAVRERGVIECMAYLDAEL